MRTSCIGTRIAARPRMATVPAAALDLRHRRTTPPASGRPARWPCCSARQKVPPLLPLAASRDAPDIHVQGARPKTGDFVEEVRCVRWRALTFLRNRSSGRWLSSAPSGSRTTASWPMLSATPTRLRSPRPCPSGRHILHRTKAHVTPLLPLAPMTAAASQPNRRHIAVTSRRKDDTRVHGVSGVAPSRRRVAPRVSRQELACPGWSQGCTARRARLSRQRISRESPRRNRRVGLGTLHQDPQRVVPGRGADLSAALNTGHGGVYELSHCRVRSSHRSCDARPVCSDFPSRRNLVK